MKDSDIPKPKSMEEFGSMGAATMQTVETIFPDHHSVLILMPKDDSDTKNQIFINAPHDVTVETLTAIVKSLGGEKYKKHLDTIEDLHAANAAREEGKLQ